MLKRTVKFGDYDTAANGWTLTLWQLEEPEMKTKYVERLGGDGSWDLSTVLTDGIPRYKTRKLTIKLETSVGTRDDREQLINDLVNRLDGLEWQVTPPDRPHHYLTGRLSVSVGVSGPAWAEVTVSGVMAPWLYHKRETVVGLTARPAIQKQWLYNTGRLAVIPELVADGTVRLTYNGETVELVNGAYIWSALLLTPGDHMLEISGDGSLTVTYREAVLR